MTIALILIIAVLIAVIFWQHKIGVEQRDHYGVIWETKDADLDRALRHNDALMDRLCVKHGTPPPGINITEQYQARTEQATANRDRTRPPVLGQREIQLQASYARKAKEIEDQAVRDAANGSS